VRAEVRDRLNPTELQGSGVGVRGTVGPRCDHVGPLGSRAMMRASVRVSGVTLRPGVPGGLGYGAAARPGCANAVSLSGASCRRCSLRARTRVPRSPLRRTVLGAGGFPCHTSAGGAGGFPCPTSQSPGVRVGLSCRKPLESSSRWTPSPRLKRGWRARGSGSESSNGPRCPSRKFQGHRAVRARPGGQTNLRLLTCPATR
jgi:hypothetical protein